MDSMDAITDIRNGLVHPDKDGEPPDGAYFEAWKLSLWYIDLILLRLCAFDGNYASRITMSNGSRIVPVPWVSAKNV